MLHTQGTSLHQTIFFLLIFILFIVWILTVFTDVNTNDFKAIESHYNCKIRTKIHYQDLKNRTLYKDV